MLLFVRPPSLFLYPCLCNACMTESQLDPLIMSPMHISFCLWVVPLRCRVPNAISMHISFCLWVVPLRCRVPNAISPPRPYFLIMFVTTSWKPCSVDSQSANQHSERLLEHQHGCPDRPPIWISLTESVCARKSMVLCSPASHYQGW